MRFTFAEAMTDVSYYAPLAQAAEKAGFAGMTIPDSIAYPEESDSTYPYTPDGKREFLEDKDFIEPFIHAAALGAVTSTLRFLPFVLKLPIRPPALVAKQASSVACLTNNRLSLGVGTSPWAEDYDILGVDFKRRGKRMNECMDIIRGLTSGGYFEFHGEFYDIPRIKMSPTPTQPVPLLVGGHADPALRRAVIRGDGWMHGGGPGEELDDLLDKIAAIRKAEGKENDPFEIHVISMDAYTVDGCRRLEDKGITDVIVGFRLPYILGADTEPLEKKIEHLDWYGENVIAKVNDGQ
ncbi:TIGR03619 family F420-dependent LLM class oxidoreductase [Gordonia sp. HY002]|uniref:TIGR03619 family F420-dependent LLM class oxidoreductase n=1 Tax=Gordonia zhenghanii TaxID=2911516 RepID=UPI001EEF8156|nr:TIGR03619 family F420-dependent LLM class oxidoreductase [Gordonia zhenghanii]MCF8569314.1 TIGR03619 family F420-dependent LLM class oxidoreductase [Gordonia zhenghanii]MCF8606674.1 TIGR03619 family F420-dependent LLM class oxidoreductase [Gordonia zhenghanii]